MESRRSDEFSSPVSLCGAPERICCHSSHPQAVARTSFSLSSGWMQIGHVGGSASTMLLTGRGPASDLMP